MKLDAWQAEGHTAHTARSETCSTWVSIDTAEATLPAGMYSVRCDGLSSGIACEFRDTGANKLLGYISDDWKTLTVTEPTTVAARLAVPPDWPSHPIGRAPPPSPRSSSKAIGGGEPLGLENLWPQENFEKKADLFDIVQSDGLLTITVRRDLTEADGWKGMIVGRIRFDEPTWVRWTPGSNTGTESAIPDCTDHVRYAINPTSAGPKLMPAGEYDLCVSIHLAKAGTYTCRPHLYRIPC